MAKNKTTKRRRRRAFAFYSAAASCVSAVNISTEFFLFILLAEASKIIAGTLIFVSIVFIRK